MIRIRLILLFTALLLTAHVFAQINPQKDWLTNTIDRLYPTKIFVERKIQTIEIEVGIKRDNARIEKTGKKYIFTYNRQGKIESLVEVNRTEYGFDSIFTFHYYNNDSKVHIKRTFNKGRYFATYETLDPEERVVRMLNCEETNQSDDFRFFKLGNQTVNQSESYQFEVINDNQLRKKFLNDNNVVYKEGIIYTEGKKKLVKQEDYIYSTTGVRINYANVYDDKSRLIETFYSSDAAGDLRESSRFTYDKDLQTEEKYYRNNAVRSHRFYFYNKESNLLESILTKGTNDYVIEIFNFTISFYQ